MPALKTRAMRTKSGSQTKFNNVVNRIIENNEKSTKRNRYQLYRNYIDVKLQLLILGETINTIYNVRPLISVSMQSLGALNRCEKS